MTEEDAQSALQENAADWVLATGVHVAAIAERSVTLVVPNSKQLRLTNGDMCGQALFAAADTAMLLAIAAAAGGFKPATSIDTTVNFMRKVNGTDAVLTASVMRLGKTLAFCRCEISGANDAGRAGFATGTYALP